MHAGAEQGQAVYAEAEEQSQSPVRVSHLHPELIGVPPQSHSDGAQQLLCLLEDLVVLQRCGKGQDGQIPTALL